jgi:hypothetical protein
MAIIFVIFAFVIACGDPEPNEQELPLVEQTVDCISVAHQAEGADLIFFWDRVQGEWTCLDYRWASSAMAVSRHCEAWRLAWLDDGDGCYRVVASRYWIESWEPESPLAEQNCKPWFRQLAHPGLKQPPIAKGSRR